MTVRNKTLTVLTLVVVTILGLMTTSVNAEVIYLETFDGDGAAVLDGQTPTQGEGTWVSGPLLNNDGAKPNPGHCSAFLPFTPEAGNVYQCSVTFDTAGDPDDGMDWFALGFAEGNQNNNFLQNGPAAWMLNRANGESYTCPGPGTAGLVAVPTADGPIDFMIKLDTTSTLWTVEWFIDGVSVRSETYATNPAINHVSLGLYNQTTGSMDNFLLEIPVPNLASSPNPADGQADVLRDADLSWTPGIFAATHDVYVGEDFADVNNATEPTDPGLDVNSLDPGRMEFGKTYYWRVDEVNGTPDKTVHKGDVWSFTAEPFSIPIEVITATASSSNAEDMGPENTINGIGLNDLDQHSTEPTDMWLSGVGDPTPSIQYAFDKAYKLNEMIVWNSNQVVEAFVGIGAKDVVIETSLDGAEWTILEDATQFAQAPGAADYVANTIIDFDGALAQYVKITVNAGYGMLPQYGISEVRFLYIPTFAREPQPADGDITEGADVVLNWRAGREAASHEVRLGTDPADLASATTTSESTYAANGLNYGITYYWQINEVNENEMPAAYAGPLWSLTTPPFGTVDDFEQYDDDCERVFFTWEDGLGHNGGAEVENCDVAPSNGNGGGSIVGNASSPFAEKAIVYAGSQSMPMEYDNAFGPSEITRSIAGQDWTASGVQSLSLMFFGGADNSGQLYVKINNTKVLYDGAVDDIQKAQWQPWNIDLSSVGANLENVTRLAIGIDGANAAGKLYIDEIRLYPKAGELIIPVEPDNTGLVASYAFDGNANDSSGSGNNGTLVGNATYDAGVSGQAISLNGVDGYVEIADDPSLDLDTALTLAAWVNLRDLDTYYFIAHKGPSGTAGDNYPGNFAFRISPAGILQLLHQTSEGQTFSTYNSNAAIAAGQWCHVAGTLTKGESVQFYINGRHAGSAVQETEFGLVNDISVKIGGRTDNYSFFNGAIDDVRLYNRVLSQAELAWLAGITDPMHKPF